ncbi:hypothetical protein [Actinomadura sp. NPDC048394]|uniref:hypothetical protein n=1 Tax=Actinomadura sp. NPDC048394 TaxID=3158223 RepID=UPI0033D2564B
MLSALLILAGLLLVLVLLAFWAPPRYQLPRGGLLYVLAYGWWFDPNSDRWEV